MKLCSDIAKSVVKLLTARYSTGAVDKHKGSQSSTYFAVACISLPLYLSLSLLATYILSFAFVCALSSIQSHLFILRCC